MAVMEAVPIYLTMTDAAVVPSYLTDAAILDGLSETLDFNNRDNAEKWLWYCFHAVHKGIVKRQSFLFNLESLRLAYPEWTLGDKRPITGSRIQRLWQNREGFCLESELHCKLTRNGTSKEVQHSLCERCRVCACGCGATRTQIPTIESQETAAYFRKQKIRNKTLVDLRMKAALERFTEEEAAKIRAHWALCTWRYEHGYCGHTFYFILDKTINMNYIDKISYDRWQREMKEVVF